MAPWLANEIALLAGVAVVMFGAIVAIWRAAAWNASPMERLIFDTGLPLGAIAPQFPVRADGVDYDPGFRTGYSFVVFGGDGCRPCADLVNAAMTHPVTSRMRRVYVSESGRFPGREEYEHDWESFEADDYPTLRTMWSVEAVPYFYAIDERGRIRGRGLAHTAEHLDELFTVHPRRRAELEIQPISTQEE